MLALSEYRSTDTNMIMADVQMLANNLMFEHGLLDQGWFFNFDRSKSRLGLCSHSNKIISMSKYLTPLRPYDENKDTILHEIAHALVGGGFGHGAVWQLKCVEIGARPERCGTIDPEAERPEFRWTASCDACGAETGMHRAPGRVRSCLHCHPGDFSFDHLLTWREFGKRVHNANMNPKFAAEYNLLLMRADVEQKFDKLLDAFEEFENENTVEDSDVESVH
jgi:hypothetical protein